MWLYRLKYTDDVRISRGKQRLLPLCFASLVAQQVLLLQMECRPNNQTVQKREGDPLRDIYGRVRD